MILKRLLHVLSITGLVLSVIGCGGGDSAGPVPSQPAPATPAVAPKPEAPAETASVEQKEEKEEPEMRYVPGKRRDPFLSILVSNEERRKLLENLPPLQRTSIDELRLIAIVWGELGYWATLQTPDGKGYTVRQGTVVGPNRGRIKKITKRSLSIEERYTDIFGDKKTRVVQLELHAAGETKE